MTEQQGTVLPGVEWDRDDLFFTYTWYDETSAFDDDPSVRWCGTCYQRQFKARVPVALAGNDELCEKFIEIVADNWPDCEGFWR